jgi:hypothetical protein
VEGTGRERPPESGGRVNPAAAPGVAHAPIVSVIVYEQKGDGSAATTERIQGPCAFRSERCHVQFSDRQPSDLRAAMPSCSTSRLHAHATAQGDGQTLCNAVAPTSILRARSAASRLRSLRSPLRGLDPPVALPVGRALIRVTANAPAVVADTIIAPERGSRETDSSSGRRRRFDGERSGHWGAGEQGRWREAGAPTCRLVLVGRPSRPTCRPMLSRQRCAAGYEASGRTCC